MRTKKNIHKSKISSRESFADVLLTSKAFKLSASSLAVAVSLGLALPSTASTDGDGFMPNPSSDFDIAAQIQLIDENNQACGDPTNPNGLAYKQAQTLGDLKAMIITPINTDKIFDVGNSQGCFKSVTEFPNLAKNIPSMNLVSNAIDKSLLEFAQRMVCQAVNDALEDSIGSINKVLDKHAKNGQIDLTGKINEKMFEQIYKISPELSKAVPPIEGGRTWNVGDIIGGETPPNGPNSGTQSDSSSNFPSNQSADTTNNPASVTPEKRSVADSAKSVLSTIFG